MRKNPIAHEISMILVLFSLGMPLCSHALDAQGTGIAALDSSTFVVSREFAGEIRLYLCVIEDGRIIIKDSGAIPYMVLDHRALNTITPEKNPAKPPESPIIKIVP